MGFSAQDHATFTGRQVEVDLSLKLRAPGATAFTDYPLLSKGPFLLMKRVDAPGAILRARIPAADPGWLDENHPAHDLKLFAEVELWASAGGKSERLFRGYVRRLVVREDHLELICQDPVGLLDSRVCQLYHPGSYTDPRFSAPLIPAPEFGARVWRVDPAYSTYAARSDGRPSPFRVAAITLMRNGSPVSADRHRIYFDQGVVRLAFDPDPGDLLILDRVSFLVEGSNDPSLVLTEALSYPQSEGGPGFDPASELSLDTVGEDLPPVRWRLGSGSVLDLWRAIRRALATPCLLHYDSDLGVVRLELLAPAPTPELTMGTPLFLSLEYDGEEVAERAVVAFYEREGYNLASNAALTDHLAGQGFTPYGWQGNQRLGSAQADLETLRDGDPNTSFGYRDLPDKQSRRFLTVDLGSEQFIEGVELTTPNSENVNSLRTADRAYLYGYRVLGSRDGVNFEAISPGGELFLRPLTRELLAAHSPDPVRYLEVWARPAFDSPGEDSLALGLGELTVIPDGHKEAVATLQPSDPSAPGYAPSTLDRLSLVGPLVKVEDRGTELGSAAAVARAASLRDSSTMPRVRVRASFAFDPVVRPGMTVQITHPISGKDYLVLVTAVVHRAWQTEVEGRLTTVEGFDP